VAVVLVVAFLGVMAWDAWKLRELRPPEDQSFEGFMRSGRKSHYFLIDREKNRLYWVTWQNTIAPYSEPVVYEFECSGRLLNWTPGTSNFEGMMVQRPVLKSGVMATIDEARAWLRAR
jgi:hypothetical protein